MPPYATESNSENSESGFNVLHLMNVLSCCTIRGVELRSGWRSNREVVSNHIPSLLLTPRS